MRNKETELNEKEIVRWNEHMFGRFRMHTVNRIAFVQMLSEASSESESFQRRLFPIKTTKSLSSEGNESETAYSVLISFQTNKYVMAVSLIHQMENEIFHDT